MSREVKRVALDFDWPLNKVWKGFVLPDELRGSKCPDCDGGQTHAGWWLYQLCYRIGMLADDIRDQERGKPLHPWLAKDSYPHGHWNDNRQFVVDRPSVEIRELLDKLLGDRPRDVFSSYASDAGYGLYKILLEKAGLDHVEWSRCKTCQGGGTLEIYEGQAAEAEAWEQYEPPTGEGWQLWESVSEGSPITPVFTTAEGLARHLVALPDVLGPGGGSLSFEAALKFVQKDGWIPSGINGLAGAQLIEMEF